MRRDIAALQKYLADLGATNAFIESDNDAEQSLPIFLTRIYDLRKCSVFDQEYGLLLCHRKERPTPSEIAKHADLARNALGRRVAFVFYELPAFERKRLIERRIPFIVPGRQTYLPMVLIDIRERATGGRGRPAQSSDALSAPAQLLVLFQLQKKHEADEWPLNKWAEALGYSRSTMTRVYKQLTSTGLCESVEQGRHVVLEFQSEKRSLWDAALPYLRSPVAGHIRARVADPELQLFGASMTALAKYTMMAPAHDNVYAMSATAVRAASEEHKIVQTPYHDDETVVIERWKYAPSLLSSDGDTVDRLSLYLSMQDDRDERVQAALKTLVQEMQW